MIQIQPFKTLIRSQQRRFITTTTSLNAAITATERLRRSFRGGQNLSERYKLLERSIRGKEDALTRDLIAKGSEGARSTQKSTSVAGPTFYGFRVPQEPQPLEDDECCMSGCAVCVYDLYEESLAAYEDEVDALRKSLVALKVPESEWPSNIRMNRAQAARESSETHRKDTMLSAFKEMERSLAKKKQDREADRS